MTKTDSEREGKRERGQEDEGELDAFNVRSEEKETYPFLACSDQQSPKWVFGRERRERQGQLLSSVEIE